MNFSIDSEIWQHHQASLMISRILGKEGIENSGSEEPLPSTPYFVLSEEQDKKSRR